MKGAAFRIATRLFAACVGLIFTVFALIGPVLSYHAHSAPHGVQEHHERASERPFQAPLMVLMCDVIDGCHPAFSLVDAKDRGHVTIHGHTPWAGDLVVNFTSAPVLGPLRPPNLLLV